jgi:hypothetical protein
MSKIQLPNLPMPSLQSFLSVFFLLSLVAKPVFAEDRFLDVDYFSTISSNDLKAKAQQSLLGVLKDFNFNVEEFDIGTDPKVHFSRVKVMAHPVGYEVTPSRQGIHFQSRNNSVRLEIGEVKVDQYIEREFNGVHARIHIFGACTGVTAGLVGPESVIEGDVNPVLSGNLVQLQLENARVALGHVQFEFSKINCVGAQGFDQLIIDSAKQLLANPAALDQVINSEYIRILQAQLATWGYQWNQPMLAFQLPVHGEGQGKGDAKNIEAWLFPQTMQIDGNGNWLNKGMLRLKHSDLSHESKHIQFQSQDFASFAGQTALVLPDEALTAFAEIYLSPQMWMLSLPSTQIPAFQDLMKSRFKQFFVWPDLMNFSKKTEFLVQTESKIAPRFQWNDDGSLGLQSEFISRMYYPEQGQFLPYNNFSVQLQGRMNLQIENGKAVVTTLDPNIKVGAEWDQAYCQKESRCGRISKSILTKAATSFLTDRKIEFPLPKLEASFGLKLEPKKISREKQRRLLILNF